MYLQQDLFNLQELNFLNSAFLRVGIFGGTFDPAHQGHLSIAMRALKFYKMDYVIWLVANQNTLKKTNERSVFERAKTVLDIVDHPKMIVSTAEYDLGFCQTYDTLEYFTKNFPQIKFTWLMGIDNLVNFHKWGRYKEIPDLCDIIVFDRPVVNRLVDIKSFKLIQKPKLAKKQINSIIVDRGSLVPLSSTEIRSKIKLG